MDGVYVCNPILEQKIVIITLKAYFKNKNKNTQDMRLNLPFILELF